MRATRPRPTPRTRFATAIDATRRGQRDARDRQLAARVPRRARARTPTSTGRASPRSTWTSTSDLPPTHSASFQRYMRERVAAQLPFREFHYLTRRHRRCAGGSATATTRCSARIRSISAAAASARTATSRSTIRRSPTSTIPLDVKIVALEPASRRQQVAEGHFATIDDVPTHAITVTIPALLRARPRARDRARGAQGGRRCATRSRARSPPRARRRTCGASRTRRCTSTRSPRRCSHRERGRSPNRTRRSALRAGVAVPEPARVRAPLPAARRRPRSSSGSRSRSRCAPQLGVAPWDVFHQGIAEGAEHLDRRRWSCSSGFVVLLAWIPLRQHLGIGTILNTLSIGLHREPRPGADPEPARARRSASRSSRSRSSASASVAASTSAPGSARDRATA